MADPDTHTKPPASPTPPTEKPARGNKSMTVDLVNNLRCARFINTGLGPDHVSIQPGETKRNVELSEAIIRELKSRANSPQGEVKVYRAGQAPDLAAKAAPAETDADEDPDTDD